MKTCLSVLHTNYYVQTKVFVTEFKNYLNVDWEYSSLVQAVLFEDAISIQRCNQRDFKNLQD